MADTEFATGLYFNPPHERAPDFVIGSISIQPEKFMEWLQAQKPNEKGYVRLSVKRAKSTGKPYVALDTYSGNERTQSGPTLPADDFDDDIPFLSHERGWLV